ncbi:O-antigen polymerase [Selenomonas ruminantium]|uniref:O-antigen polymerase n=1 Tax=Selenomonas ruminantium TaxID=971 RepID=UPI000423941D|nr:O-antigen polymerase [Selenomonas ruminantium]
MNNLYLIILFVITIVLFSIEYYKCKYDLANPVVGVFLFFSISLLFATSGNDSWGNYISGEYLLIIILGYVGIIAGGEIGARIKKKKRINLNLGITRIELSKKKRIVVIGLACVLTILYVRDIIQLGSSLNAVGFGVIAAVRGDENVSGNFYLRQGIKYIMAAAYVNNYIFVNNCMSNKFKKTDIMYILPFICGCVCSIFTGVRTEIFRLVISFFVYFVVLNNEKHSWQRKNKTIKMILKRFAIPMLGLLFLFFALRSIVKASTNLAENKAYGFIQYLEFYIGSSWIVLNEKIKLGLDNLKSNYFGENSFPSVWKDLTDFGLVSNLPMCSNREFYIVDPVTRVGGNVDTIFGRALIDFDILGMMLFVFIVFLLLSYYYNANIKNTYRGYQRDKSLIIYSFLYYAVAFSFYANIINYLITVYFILTIIMIVLLYWYYFGKSKIKIKF